MNCNARELTAFAAVILSGTKLLIERGDHDEIPTDVIVKSVASQVWNSYWGEVTYAEHEIATCIALGALARRSTVQMAERELDHLLTLLPTDD